MFIVSKERQQAWHLRMGTIWIAITFLFVVGTFTSASRSSYLPSLLNPRILVASQKPRNCCFIGSQEAVRGGLTREAKDSPDWRCVPKTVPTGGKGDVQRECVQRRSRDEVVKTQREEALREIRQKNLTKSQEDVLKEVVGGARGARGECSKVASRPGILQIKISVGRC